MNHYYDITLTEHHTMNLPSQPCETRPDYVFQTCVRRKLSARFTFILTMIRQSSLQRWHKSMTIVSFFSDQSTSSWISPSQNTSPNSPKSSTKTFISTLGWSSFELANLFLCPQFAGRQGWVANYPGTRTASWSTALTCKSTGEPAIRLSLVLIIVSSKYELFYQEVNQEELKVMEKRAG